MRSLLIYGYAATHMQSGPFFLRNKPICIDIDWMISFILIFDRYFDKTPIIV